MKGRGIQGKGRGRGGEREGKERGKGKRAPEREGGWKSQSLSVTTAVPS